MLKRWRNFFQIFLKRWQNTVEIAKRCNVALTLGKNYLPDTPIPDGYTIDQFIASEAEKGLEERLDVLLDRECR